MTYRPKAKTPHQLLLEESETKMLLTEKYSRITPTLDPYGATIEIVRDISRPRGTFGNLHNLGAFFAMRGRTNRAYIIGLDACFVEIVHLPVTAENALICLAQAVWEQQVLLLEGPILDADFDYQSSYHAEQLLEHFEASASMWTNWNFQ